MLFFIGDKVRNTMREADGVVSGMKGDLVLVDYGRGPAVTSSQYLVLKSKATDIQAALRNDPEALQQLVPFVARILVSCEPKVADQLATELSEVSNISALDASDYIRVVTDRSHGAKFDILLRDAVPETLMQRLGVFFTSNGHRAKVGEVQVNSRGLAEWLMKEHNLLPEKQIVV